jgi:hypothetical protein
VFANLRPANILPQLIDASSLKREIVEGGGALYKSNPVDPYSLKGAWI